MKVTATARGFFGHLREVGAEFDIPDKPKRKLRSADDPDRIVVDKKGEVPEAFASSWMRLGWGSDTPRASGIAETIDTAAANLNDSVI